MKELQKVHHIYTGDVYEGTLVATDAELAASPYTSGAAPSGDYVLNKRRGGMVVSRFQAKAALSAAGLLDKTEALVARADPITQLAWAEVIEFRRNSPTILALQGAMGLTDAQLDALFLAASAIEA